MSTERNLSKMSHFGLWCMPVILGFMWTNFVEPSLVFADDLAPLKNDIGTIKTHIKQNNESQKMIHIMFLEARIEDHQDRVVELEAKMRHTDLTSEEFFMLDSYKNKIEKYQRDLSRLEG